MDLEEGDENAPIELDVDSDEDAEGSEVLGASEVSENGGVVSHR